MTLTESLIAFTFAATILTLTPGLDTALILRTATVEGSKKAFHAAFGIQVGCLIWGAMVAFDLGTLIAASELAYNILKWCGVPLLAGFANDPETQNRAGDGGVTRRTEAAELVSPWHVG